MRPFVLSDYERPHAQSGIALLPVLLFLSLIMIAGVVAVRQSRTDLNVATSDQAATLTLNASDSILAHIERIANVPNIQNPSSEERNAYSMLFSQNYGVFGYFLVQAKDKTGEQIMFCYKPKEVNSLFERVSARTLLLGGGIQGNASNAICNPSKPQSYTSGRNVVMTQVTLVGANNGSSDNFQDSRTGTSADNANQNIVPRINIHSTSVLPGLSNVTEEAITSCLSRPVGTEPHEYGNIGINPETGQAQNMDDCLKSRSIPATSLVEEVILLSVSKGGFDPATGQMQNINTQDSDYQAATSQ